MGKKDKEEVEGRKKGGTSGAQGSDTRSLGEDEMIVKKKDWQKMEDELGKLRKEVQNLEKELERLKEFVGEEKDKVVVPEKSMETLRDKIDTLKRTFEQVIEGKEPDASASGGKGATPKKSGAHNPDKPPDAEVAKLVKRKRVEVRS